MQIKRDVFRINSGAVEVDGTKLEPEAQTVEHVFQGSAPVSVTTPGVNPMGTVGAVPLEIVAHGEAGQVARSVSGLCANCRFFDRTAWLKMLHDADNPGSSEAEKHSVNAIRAEILLRMPESEQHVGGDGDYDIEHALKAMGMCHALREFYTGQSGEDPGIIGVWPSAGCPEDVVAPDRPRGLFKPKDADAERASAMNYDAVLQRAAGRIA